MAKKASPVRAEDGPVKRSNPDYQRTEPTEVTINGLRCVNLDGANIADAARIAREGRKL